MVRTPTVKIPNVDLNLRDVKVPAVKAPAVDSTPLYAVIGAGDVLVAKLREVRAERPTVPAFDAKAVRAEVETQVDTVRTQVRELPEHLQDAVSHTVATAIETYGDLAERGKKLVIRIRRQQATQDLKGQAKSTATRTKAATTTAKKSATRTRKAAGTTARTARKSAAETKSAAKGVVTSAEKTATAAVAATEAAAEKVGE